MVVGNKNKKFEKFFYSMPHKHLRRKYCPQFCIFSYQKCISVQLWGAAFMPPAENQQGKSKIERLK
jgi:hypothetical protein